MNKARIIDQAVIVVTVTADGRVIVSGESNQGDSPASRVVDALIDAMREMKQGLKVIEGIWTKLRRGRNDER